MSNSADDSPKPARATPLSRRKVRRFLKIVAVLLGILLLVYREGLERGSRTGRPPSITAGHQ